MNYIFGNAVVGLPSLGGVILGLMLYLKGGCFFIYPAIMLFVPLILLLIAKSIMHTHPRTAWILIELWIFSAVAVTTFATAFVIWASLDTPVDKLLSSSGLDAEHVKAVSGIFIGAVSTYVALVWTKDIGDAQGVFWPSTQFKSAIGKAFMQLHPEPNQTERVYQASYQKNVDDYGDIGWGFSARWKRAKVFAEYLRQAAH
jgi:hypothetical protein